jgi:4-amino-4-deoxy-L-arabinose transferase-like glycosyltransferase
VSNVSSATSSATDYVQSMHDRSNQLGAALVVVGGTLVLIGLAVSTEPWRTLWFLAGGVIGVLGLVLIVVPWPWRVDESSSSNPPDTELSYPDSPVAAPTTLRHE